MFYNKPTVILRHKKENKNKCSLKGLEQRQDFSFYTYPKDSLPDLNGYFLLDLSGEPLSDKDLDMGIFLIDGTWKYASIMADKIKDIKVVKRRIPKRYFTAYPRKQTGCIEPEFGLASIEALYLAYRAMGKDTTGLLDN